MSTVNGLLQLLCVRVKLNERKQRLSNVKAVSLDLDKGVLRVELRDDVIDWLDFHSVKDHLDASC